MPEIELIELHKASAHFPIALLMSNVFFDLAARIFKKPHFQIVSYWIHLLGVVAAIVTITLGSLGNPFFEDVGLIGSPWKDYGNDMIQKAAQHSWMGITSFLLFAVLAVWRVKRNGQFAKAETVIYLSAAVLGVGLLGLAGYLGSHVMD